MSAHPDHAPLPRTPHDLPAAFVHRFNSGDLELLEELFDPEGVFVPPAGPHLTNPQAIRQAHADFLNVGLPIEMRPLHVAVTDGIALVIATWEITGTSNDNQPVNLHGTATDVARRGPDGYWRYFIDCPFGINTGP